MLSIFHSGRIYTVDSTAPWVEAFAVRDGRIAAIGSNTDILALADDSSEQRDLGGAFVMPGFVDVHNHHFISGREELFELAVPIGADLDGILGAVEKYVDSHDLQPDEWIVGSPWASDLLDALNTPEALKKLDAVSAGHPVVLTDDSHHNRWANSRAMEIADIADNPTGVLFESAGLPVARAQAKESTLTLKQQQAASKRAMETLHSYGITAFQDAGVSTEILAALHALDENSELHAWVVTSMLINDDIFGFDAIGDDLVFNGEQYRSTHHRPDFVKIFLDGVPPTRTGAFVEPYLPDDAHPAHHCGDTSLAPDELLDWLRRTAKAGLSAKIHCTGDASVHAVLNAVEALREEGFTDTRYHVAHGQFVIDSDIPRFRSLNVDADVSPFIWVPGPIHEAISQVLPQERADRMHPIRDQLDAGVLVTGGSDWPVSPTPNPWEGIEGLVTRQDPSGRYPGSLWPEQAISLSEAIEVFTVNGAKAMGLDEHCGTLTAGKSADFVILDRNPFDADPGDLAETRAVETWFAGRQVYSA